MDKVSLTYRPEIDGLRSVAVLAVILYHADFDLFKGGFIGVDVFFVISGFLITSILLADLNRECFSLFKFYERRCRRILPPLVVMALVVVIIGWFWLLPSDYRDFGSCLQAMAIFVANHWFFIRTGYFDSASYTKPLLHTWSLSVEEQFYIILPVLLFLLYRRGREDTLKVLLTLFILSLVASCFWTFYWPEASFYLLPSRFWELLTGSLLAFWPKSGLPGKRIASLLSGVGLSLIIVSAVFFDHSTYFPGPGALLPCLGAAIFIIANSPGARSDRAFLSRSAPVFIGKISYSLYLWHWPLLVIPRYVNDAPLSRIMVMTALGATFIAAYLSWRWVENPVRFRKIFASSKAIFLASALSLMLLIFIGQAIKQSGGFLSRMPESALALAKWDGGLYKDPPGTYLLQSEANGTEFKFKAWDIRPGSPPSFMVMGNSHSRMWLAAIDQLAEEYKVSGLVVDSFAFKRCLLLKDQPPETPEQKECQDRLTAFLDLAQARGVKRVLWGIRYSYYLGPVMAQTGEASGPVGEELARDLASTLKAAQDRGLELWFLENVPEYDQDIRHTIAVRALKGLEPASMGYDLEFYNNRNATFHQKLPELIAQGLNVLNVTQFICPDNLCLPGDLQGSYYIDENHLSSYGALTFRQALVPLFEGLRVSEYDENDQYKFDEQQ